MNRRVAVCFVAALVAVAVAYFALPALAGRFATRPVVLQIGSAVRLQGTNVGCGAVKRGGEAMVECLDTANRLGTYATLIGTKDVLVVRFQSAGVAKTVFHARQLHARFTTCRG